jgi:2-hydroxy-6-oxonona-2,4-dienedioate hydrolase
MDAGRYRDAERTLWDEAGATPLEHRIHLARNDVAIRVLEVGEGPPAVFVHGGPGAAAPVWAHLAARLPDLRCLLVDRPGCGLSDPHPLAGPAAVRAACASLVGDVLDGLGIDRAHVVGSSHGSYAALFSAAAEPGRVERTVHFGCPGFVEGMRVTGFDRLVLLPGAHRLLARLPAGERGMRATFRQLGHEAAAGGPITHPFVDWGVALQRHTETMRHELATMATLGTFRGGFDPALTVDRALLGSVRSPTHFLWGDRDPYGDRRVADEVVAAMPTATLEVLRGAGHLCWLDDPDRAAVAVRGHLLTDAPATAA